MDPSTASNYNAWRIKHVKMKFHVSFIQQQILAACEYQLERTGAVPSQLILDTNCLDIESVATWGSGKNEPLKYELKQWDP